MDNALVSIVIPLYNAEEFIGETIESVINQSYSYWELIIVDDCSTDGSVNIVKQYLKNDNIILIENIQNCGGPAGPRNIGVKNAKGSFIAFLDADDIWHSEKLKVQVDFMKLNPSIIILGTNAETFPQKYKNKLYLRNDLPVSFKYLLKSNKFITSSVLIRSEIVSQVGYFDENKEVRAAEDYDFWLRILSYKDHSGYVINQPLVKYRIHNQNISLYQDENSTGHYDRLLYIYKKHPQFFSNGEIQKLQQNKIYLNRLRSIKDAYHRETVSTCQILFGEKLRFTDRVLLVIKKFVLNILKQRQ